MQRQRAQDAAAQVTVTRKMVPLSSDLRKPPACSLPELAFKYASVVCGGGGRREEQARLQTDMHVHKKHKRCCFMPFHFTRRLLVCAMYSPCTTPTHAIIHHPTNNLTIHGLEVGWGGAQNRKR